MTNTDFTWDDLVRLQPGLGRLYDEAMAIRDMVGDTGTFCANAYWYGYGHHLMGFIPTPPTSGCAANMRTR
jgi:hypothetical protein